MQLSWLEGIRRHDLDLPEVVATFADEILSLDDPGILRHHREGLVVRVILVVGPLVSVQQREMGEDLTAHITFEANVGNLVLKEAGRSEFCTKIISAA